MTASKTIPNPGTVPAITVKKVQKTSSSHPDSYALYADVYVDGVRVGTAEDDGWGGGAYLRPIRPGSAAVEDAIKRADDWSKTQCFPDDPSLELDKPLHYPGLGEYALMLASQIVDERARKRLVTKYKKECLTKTFFATEPHRLGWMGATGERAISAIRKKYGDGAVIFSMLPDDEATSRYLKHFGY
jgi:hypothetical protein